MRLASSVFLGFALALGMASGFSTLAQRIDAYSASRQQVALAQTSTVDLGNPAPPRFIPRHSNVPSPTPPATAAPTAPPAPVVYAPPKPVLVIGSTQQVLINRDRAAYGLGPLTWSSCLYNVAIANARRMAAQGYISHTNGPYADLACGLGGQAGENVGYWSGGINDVQLNTMFMNSPDHRANILGPYHYVATAWVVAANGYAYIAVEFT